MRVWALVTLLALGCSCISARIIDRCDLARDLKYNYGIPNEDLGIWVCIAQRESNFDTRAVGRLNEDGSTDNGIFQINNRYWCSPPGTGCNLPCDALLDDDIYDDVQCSLRVKSEQGFQAWTTFPKFCSDGRGNDYIGDCGVL